jgi:hypothetical protein
MPYRRYHIPWLAFMLITGLSTCREVYEPPAIARPNRFLVVDGFINTNPGGTSAINLNRTRNLGDTTVIGFPELNAQLSIVGSNGVQYPLIDTASTGIYTSPPLSLDITLEYHLFIKTVDGETYESDPVPCQVSPPIDSIYWRQPSDLTIYASTHDPTGSAHYFRYDYNETWEHDSEFDGIYGVSNHMMYAVDSTTQKHRCWTTDTSHNVILANTSSETQDVVADFPLLTIPNSDNRLTRAYSIIVRQYAISKGQYDYWQLIQRLTQNVGTLFDLQPTQIEGNIHSTSNPAEPVIGYLGACALQQQRIGIIETYLHNWIHNTPAFGCDTLSIPFDFYNPFAYNYEDPNYAPYYFDGPALVLGSTICLDCTLLGGTNIHPTFMPE